MKNNPELLISPRQAQRLYLQSYSMREVYHMCEIGRIRALYEQRSRRKWSIPVSAILEFQQNLISNCEQQELASQRGVRPAIVSTANPIQSGRRVISFPKEVLK